MRVELDDLLKTIAVDSPAQIKEARRKIEKLWRLDSKKFTKSADVLFDYLRLFDKISNPKNQAALVSGSSLFFLALSDDHFDILKNFILKAIQNPHGHVREATRKTAEWLYVSLTDRIDPFRWGGKKLTAKQILGQQLAKEQYREYLTQVGELMDHYSYQNDDQTTYIDEMKPSVLKSLELLYDHLTFSCESAQFLHIPSPAILLRRKEIENKLALILKKTKPQVSLHMVKQMIYLENNLTDLHKVIDLFIQNKTRSDFLEGILTIVNDAWNHFPHRCLGGQSPMELRGRIP